MKLIIRLFQDTKVGCKCMYDPSTKAAVIAEGQLSNKEQKVGETKERCESQERIGITGGTSADSGTRTQFKKRPISINRTKANRFTLLPAQTLLALFFSYSPHKSAKYLNI